MSVKMEDIDLNSIQENNLVDIQKSLEVLTSVSESILEEEQIESKGSITCMKEEQDMQVVVHSTPSTPEENLDEMLIQDINRNLFGKLKSFMFFLYRYILTASFIFVVLMAFTNYSAYVSIAKSYLNPEALIQSELNLQKSIEVSKISQEDDVNTGAAFQNEALMSEGTGKLNLTENNLKEATVRREITEEEIQDEMNMKNILGDTEQEAIQLDIEIIPFVNRIVVPKIAKNIPLIDIIEGEVETFGELNDMFMDELRSGVVRYPGSAQPGEYGNAFIFGHSSNFPWIKGDYNDVFALLDRLDIGDEVISYYEGKKYVYKVKEKKVISPKDVSILKRDTGRKEMTLMTCWPIGTTYNRLLIIAELVT